MDFQDRKDVVRKINDLMTARANYEKSLGDAISAVVDSNDEQLLSSLLTTMIQESAARLKTKELIHFFAEKNGRHTIFGVHNIFCQYVTQKVERRDFVIGYGDEKSAINRPLLVNLDELLDKNSFFGEIDGTFYWQNGAFISSLEIVIAMKKAVIIDGATYGVVDHMVPTHSNIRKELHDMPEKGNCITDDIPVVDEEIINPFFLNGI